MSYSKFRIAQILGRILPPIFAQTVRNKLISIKHAEKLAIDFKRKSFTGSYFTGNTSDFHAFKFCIHGFFDWRNVVLTRLIINKYKTGDVIEVGANIGTETISFADITKKKGLKTYAYEPVQSNLEYIERFTQSNNLHNLIVKNCLVSDYKGVAKFKVPTKNDSGSGYISNDDEDREFKVIKIDDHHGKESISVICVDVEGFEYQVLKGAEKLLLNQQPYVIIEVNQNYLMSRSNISLETFYKYIIDLGYTPFYIKSLGLEKVDVKNYKILPNKNWICIPNKFVKQHSIFSREILINAFNPFNN